jgi:hypothetical protein
MNNALSFALPEDLLGVSKDAEAGIPIDAITCAIDRADSVLTLLEDHFDSDKPRLANHVLASVIWDVRGTLGLIKTLTLHGDATSTPRVETGGAQ